MQTLNPTYQTSNRGGSRSPATAFDIDCVSCAGSVGLLPKTPEARLYCHTALTGWAVFGGVYFIPRASAALVLRQLTKRYRVRIDGELVS